MDPEVRKKTLRMISNGVYIVTARHGDQFGGATVTWLSQASFKPPLLMAALRSDSNVFRCLENSRTAAVHIVGSDQRDIAQRFFSPTVVSQRMMNGEPFHLSPLNTPILDNAAAYVECRVEQILNGTGDHTIVIFQVIEAECRKPVDPLTVAESPWRYGG